MNLLKKQIRYQVKNIKLHYNHTKIFKEKQLKKWSKKARKLRDSYTDEKLEEFKIELKN